MKKGKLLFNALGTVRGAIIKHCKTQVLIQMKLVCLAQCTAYRVLLKGLLRSVWLNVWKELKMMATTFTVYNVKLCFIVVEFLFGEEIVTEI